MGDRWRFMVSLSEVIEEANLTNLILVLRKANEGAESCGNDFS